jgi:arsenite-transporting ATPase
MVLRETQRAFVYFLLHGLSVDQIIVNRVLPDSVKDEWFSEWRVAQGGVLQEIERYFAPIPVKRVPLFTHEVLGRERLAELARVLYGDRDDPSVVTQTEAPFRYEKSGDQYSVRLRLPFAAKGEVGLFKKGDELVVTVGTLRRHIGLPTSMAGLIPSHARLENQELVVEMKENEV